MEDSGVVGDSLISKNSLIFDRLKPITTSILFFTEACINKKRINGKKELINSIQTLSKILRTIDSTKIPTFYEYIVFPLRVILKHRGSGLNGLASSTTEESLNCFYQLLLNTTQNDISLGSEAFIELWQHSIIALEAVCSSEEEKMLAINLLQVLFEPTSPSLITSLKFIRQDNTRLRIGHSFSVLLKISLKSQCHSLRFNSLLVVQNMIHSIFDPDILVNVLPGTVSELTKLVVSQDLKTIGNVTSEAIKTWKCIVTSVLSDEKNVAIISGSASSELINPSGYTICDAPDVLTASSALHIIASKSRDTSTIGKKNQNINTATNMKQRSMIPMMVRDQEWLQYTASRLRISLQQMTDAILTHEKPYVRRSLLDVCISIIGNCKNTLRDALVICVECILVLSCDVNESIVSIANEAKENIKSTGVIDRVFDTVHQRFLSHMSSLIQTTNQSEMKLYHKLQLIKGHLNLLSNQLNIILSDTEFKTIVSSLAHLFQFRIDSDTFAVVRKSDGRTSGDTENLTEPFIPQYYRKNYEFMLQSTTFDVASQIASELGNREDILSSILSHVLLLIAPTHTNLSSLASVSGTLELFLRIGSSNPSYLRRNMHSLVSSIVASKWWVSDIEDVTIILIDLIGLIAEASEASFKPLLLHCLYPLLEKLASCVPCVRQFSLVALHRVARGCTQEGQISDLIAGNLDYIVQSVSSRFRHLDEYPSTPEVISVVWEYAGGASLPLLTDATHLTLVSLDQNNRSLHTKHLLKVIVVIMKSLSQRCRMVSDESTTKGAIASSDSIDEVKDYFLNKSNEMSASETHSEEDCVDGDDEKDDSENWKPAPGSEYEIAVTILTKVVYFLSSNDLTMKLQAMKVISTGIRFLPEAILRPILHNMWKPFLAIYHNRFANSNTTDLIHATNLLDDMTSAVGDFLSSRLAKDLLPVLIKLLSNYIVSDISLIESESETQSEFIPHSMKLPLCILKVLIKLGNNDPTILFSGINEVIDATSPILLNTKPQHPRMKAACIELWKTLVTVDCDLMALYVENLLRESLCKDAFGVLVAYLDATSIRLCEDNCWKVS